MKRRKHNIIQALEYGRNLFKNAGIESYSLDTQVILAHVLNRNREWILSHVEHEIEENDYNLFSSLVKKRALGCPVQYITNRCEFYSLDFYIDERALIPRADTEIITGLVIDAVSGNEKKVLEIGTGSGCIAVTVAVHCNNIIITAVDLGLDALEVATINADRHNVTNRIKFLNIDIFSGLPNFYETFDIIISNPPYIETGQIKELPPSVRLYEPLTALDGGVDGLDFYRVIAKTGRGLLSAGGMVFLEIGSTQAIGVKKILLDNLYKDIKIIKDLSGLDRVVTGVRG